MQDMSGSIWAATDSAICVFNEYQSQALDTIVTCTFQDTRNTVWAASAGDGLYVLHAPRGLAISLISPSGGEIYHAGDTMHIQWYADTSAIYSVQLSYTTDDGRNWTYMLPYTVDASDSLWGDFPWVIPDTLAGNEFRIRVWEFYGDAGGTSGPFSIVPQGAVRSEHLCGPAVRGLAAHTDPKGMVITYTLGAAARVRLDMFDMRGRRVATLARGTRAAGAHRVLWNSRDPSTGPTAAGIYYCVLSAQDAGEKVLTHTRVLVTQ
jgi:hypothetical protein